MVGHQEKDVLGCSPVILKAFQNAFGDEGSPPSVAFPHFPDVMQKGGEVEGFRIFYFRKNVEKEDVLSLREALEMIKGLQKMDSHGIEMVVVKLDHVLNFCKLGNEGGQEPCFEHLVKTIGGPAVIDDSQESAHSPRRAPEWIINQI